jgi:hypothetical protein
MSPVAAGHPADGGRPAGQVFHAAGPSADGWTIVAVHDSQASWETFRDAILLPRMQAVGCVKDLGRFLGLLIMQRLLRCGAR